MQSFTSIQNIFTGSSLLHSSNVNQNTQILLTPSEGGDILQLTLIPVASPSYNSDVRVVSSTNRIIEINRLEIEALRSTDFVFPPESENATLLSSSLAQYGEIQVAQTTNFLNYYSSEVTNADHVSFDIIPREVFQLHHSPGADRALLAQLNLRVNTNRIFIELPPNVYRNATDFYTEQGLIDFYTTLGLENLSSLVIHFNNTIPSLTVGIRSLLIILILAQSHPLLSLVTSRSFWNRSIGSIFISLRVAINRAYRALDLSIQHIRTNTLSNVASRAYYATIDGITQLSHSVISTYRSNRRNWSLDFANIVFNFILSNARGFVLFSTSISVGGLVYYVIRSQRASAEILNHINALSSEISRTAPSSASSTISPLEIAINLPAPSLFVSLFNELGQNFIVGLNTVDNYSIRFVLEQLQNLSF